MAQIVTITNPLTGQPAQVDQLDHTAQQIDDGLNIARNVSNPNLLDNWYFGNPVNQRGQTSYTGTGYGIDRWLNAYNPNNFAVLITDNGLAVSGSAIDGPFIMQRFERDFGGKLSGKTVTFSVLTTNGLYSGTAIFPVENTPDVPIVDNADIFMYFQWSQASANLPCAVFVMRNADIKYIAAKLELGSQQTLAHQENGVWQLNEIPDYGEQLARCMRYFQVVTNGTLVGSLYTSQSGRVYYHFPVTMRDNPGIIINPKGLTLWGHSPSNGSHTVNLNAGPHATVDGFDIDFGTSDGGAFKNSGFGILINTIDINTINNEPICWANAEL